MTLIIIYIIIAILIIYYIFLKYNENKINKLEEKIKRLFLERTSFIPSIFEISENHLSKHRDIFNEILNLRKVEFSQSNNNIELSQIMNTKKLIHHEINFIFKTCNRHSDLIKQGNFIFLRNLIMKKSNEIGENMENYKKYIKIFNKLIFYKNITIIGLLLPISKKIKI